MPLPKASNALFGNSFFIFITRFFPSLATLLVLIGYSRHLPQADYGQYQHFWIQLNIIYPLACFGIHVLVITYSAGFLRSLMGRLNAMHYALYGIWVVALSAVFALLQCSSLSISFIVPFLFLLTFSLSVVLESFLIVLRDYKSLVATSILYSAAYCYIHWYVLAHGFSLQLLFTCLLIISALRFFIYAVVFMGSNKKAVADDGGYELKKVRSLWLHLGFYDVTQTFFNWIDKFVISLVLSASVSAVYYNGSQTIPFLPLLLSAAGSAMLMQLAAGNKSDETANTIELVNRSGRLLSCIVFPVFCFLFLFRQEVIGILGHQYAAAVPVFAVSILVLPLRAYSFTTVLQRLHKGNIINIGSVADLLLACALMYPLYCLLGLPGVALSFVISSYLQGAFYLYYAARLLGVSPFALIPYGNWTIKGIVFSCVLIAIRYVCGGFNNPANTLILGGVTMAVLIGASLYMELIKNKKHGIAE